MKQKDSHSAPVPRPSFTVWTLHWVSALLVLFLLATSLASGLGFTKRLLPAMWMDWHLSAGVVLLVVTAIRMKSSRPWNGLTRIFLGRGWDVQAIKPFLLFVLILVLLSGLVIFQKPPIGRAGILFGLFPMPTMVRLDHSFHSWAIDLHIALSFAAAVLVIAHAAWGLRRSAVLGRSRIAVMLWPWR